MQLILQKTANHDELYYFIIIHILLFLLSYHDDFYSLPTYFANKNEFYFWPIHVKEEKWILFPTNVDEEKR